MRRARGVLTRRLLSMRSELEAVRFILVMSPFSSKVKNKHSVLRVNKT
jgi:hypothetical protein